MAENNLLLTVTLVILGVALFSPSLTGNYQYGNECGSPGETFCDSTSAQYQGTYKTCVYDERLGRNVWGAIISCPNNQVCVNKQLSYGVNQAECVWSHLPKQY